MIGAKFAPIIYAGEEEAGLQSYRPAPSMFTLDGVQFFLTYAQAEFDFDDLYKFIDGVNKVQWLRVCREEHESGEPHMHCVFKLHKRFKSTQDPRLWDLGGRHPNILPVRSIAATLTYVSKGGNFKDYGPVPAIAGQKKKFDIGKVLEAVKGPRRDYNLLCCSMGLSMQWADRIWQDENNKDPRNIESTLMSDISRESILLQMSTLPTEGPIVVSIVGPSGCGKTSWAKRVVPKPALFVTHMDDLRAFRVGYHKGIVFDDMSFKHMPREAQIHISDWHATRSIHCRYGTALIPEETVKIFTSNEYPFIDDPAINRRVVRLDVV